MGVSTGGGSGWMGDSSGDGCDRVSNACSSDEGGWEGGSCEVGGGLVAESFEEVA